MTAIDVGPAQLHRFPAGFPVTVHTGGKAFLCLPDDGAVRRDRLRIGDQFVHVFVKYRDADVAHGIEILQQAAQFLQIKYGNHRSLPGDRIGRPLPVRDDA